MSISLVKRQDTDFTAGVRSIDRRNPVFAAASTVEELSRSLPPIITKVGELPSNPAAGHDLPLVVNAYSQQNQGDDGTVSSGHSACPTARMRKENALEGSNK